MLQPGADPVRKVSIIPRGRALGVTLSTPEADRYGYDANYLRGRIIGALGGMAAEQEVFNVVTTGAESDLEMVTRIARSMVGRWGMSERIGTLSVLPADGDPRMAGISDGLLDAVDEEVRRITDECYAEARRLLRRTATSSTPLSLSCWPTRAWTKPRSTQPPESSARPPARPPRRCLPRRPGRRRPRCSAAPAASRLTRFVRGPCDRPVRFREYQCTVRGAATVSFVTCSKGSEDTSWSSASGAKLEICAGAPVRVSDLCS